GVDLGALGLAVWAVRSADLGTLIPLQAHPAQRVEQRAVGRLGVAGRVGVFDAEHERAAVVAREGIVEQGRAHHADMGVAGGGWGEADADGTGGGVGGCRGWVGAASHANSLYRSGSVAADYAVGQGADVLNGDGDGVADLERADACGRAGEDHVPGQQRHRLAHVRDQVGHVADHLRGAAGLLELVVDRAGQREVGRVDLGFDPRAERAEGVEALRPPPLPFGPLQVAGGHVVGAGVAEHYIFHAFAGNLAAQPADHDREFGLEVDLFGDLRVRDGLVRADDAGGGLEEG